MIYLEIKRTDHPSSVSTRSASLNLPPPNAITQSSTRLYVTIYKRAYVQAGPKAAHVDGEPTCTHACNTRPRPLPDRPRAFVLLPEPVLVPRARMKTRFRSSFENERTYMCIYIYIYIYICVCVCVCVWAHAPRSEIHGTARVACKHRILGILSARTHPLREGSNVSP